MGKNYKIYSVLITLFVIMEAKPVPQQQNPNILEIVRLILLFLKTVFTESKKTEIKTALSYNSFPQDDPMFLLYFMYIVLLDKNLARSKKDKTFDSLKSLLLYRQTNIEQWETILLTFLNQTPRKSDFPWTDEENDVWKLILFFISEQFGKIICKEHHFMFLDETRRAQLSPLIRQLGLKPFKETNTSPAENPCAKKYQTVICRICEFHGDPKDPSKTCCCCYECGSKDADCKRCRICEQHDSTKCTCCPICNTSAEGCQKCPECNEHECSC